MLISADAESIYASASSQVMGLAMHYVDSCSYVDSHACVDSPAYGNVPACVESPALC